MIFRKEIHVKGPKIYSYSEKVIEFAGVETSANFRNSNERII